MESVLSASAGRTSERYCDMNKPKPLTSEDGEVRELLLADIKRFRPASEVLSPALVKELRIGAGKAQDPPARSFRMSFETGATIKRQTKNVPDTPWYRDKVRKRDAAEEARTAATDPREQRRLRARRDRYQAMIT